MKKTLFTRLTYVAILFLLIPSVVKGATFSFDIPKNVSLNEEVLVKLKIHTEGETLNALSGEIIIPPEIEISNIYDGDSALLLWVEKPVFKKESKRIYFSGITPGGILGERNIFSFIMRANASGAFNLSLSEVSSLKNDGLGSLVKVSSLPASVVVGSEKSSSQKVITDILSPEAFLPVIAKSSDIFDNQPFISFITHDKGVGIDRYEYMATRLLSPKSDGWTVVESPFLIPDKDLSKKIHIKAVDKSGNDRIVSVTGPNYFVNMALWSIIILLIILCVLFTIKRFLL